MTDPIMEEVYRAREKLWQRAGGTMRGLGEYLMECDRRAKARGVKWLDSEEELEAIGAEVRARLAAEAAGEAVCVGEPEGEYRAGGKNLTQRHGEAEAQRGVAAKGTKKAKGEALRAVKSERRKVKNGGGEAQKGRKGRKALDVTGRDG